MGRIRRTFELAKASWEVLKQDKELVLLPVLSLLATLAVAATFLIPIVTGGDAAAFEDPGTTEYVLLGIAYLVLAFITIFFNAALVHAANERMEGGDPTIGSALAGAMSRVHRILPWAIVSATVSIILQAIEERAGTIGRVVSGLAGLAWSLVTFLVLPVLVIEDIGVVEGVKRSGSMFKRTWGENVAAQVGFGLLGFLAALPAVLMVVAGFAVGEVAGIVMLVAAVVWILLVTMVISALSGIFQTALYRYANGMAAGAFAPAELEQAFATRRGRTGGFGGGFVQG
jgi:hypothetical protein